MRTQCIFLNSNGCKSLTLSCRLCVRMRCGHHAGSREHDRHQSDVHDDCSSGDGHVSDRSVRSAQKESSNGRSPCCLAGLQFVRKLRIPPPHRRTPAPVLASSPNCMHFMTSWWQRDDHDRKRDANREQQHDVLLVVVVHARHSPVPTRVHVQPHLRPHGHAGARRSMWPDSHCEPDVVGGVCARSHVSTL